jgi:hypothetical protein
MAQSIGSLLVSLGLDAAEFTSGLTKSEYQAKKFAQQMDRAVAGAIIKAEIAIRAFGAAAEYAVEAFKTLTQGAAEFADLSDKTGDTAENLASLAVASAVAGVSMGDIAEGANKLTKSLVGVDDESKAAGAALTALNINVADFKKLSPVQQYEAVGKALDGFADGAGKVAVAQALFGKAGAEQLRVFKALQELGGAQVILTQKQIDLADAYHDRQAKTTALLKLYAQAAATEALPALTDLTAATVEFIRTLTGLGEQANGLKSTNSVAKFAEDATDALAFLVDAGQGVSRVFRSIGTEIAFELALIKTLKDQGIAAAQALARAGRDDSSNIFSAPLFSQQLAQARAQRKELDRLRSIEDRGFTPAGKTLNFAGAISGAKGSVAAARSITDYATEVGQALGRMIEGSDLVKIAEVNDQLRELEHLASLGLDVRIVSSVQASLLEKLPKQLEDGAAGFRKLEIAAENASDGFRTELLKNYNDEQERLNRLLEATPTGQLEKLRDDMRFLADQFERGLINPGKGITAEQFIEAAQQRLGYFNEKLKESKSLVEELGLTFTSSFEDAIVGANGLSEVLRGLEKDIIRIITRKAITEPLGKSIIDAMGDKGDGSGFLSSIGQFFAGIFGGGREDGGIAEPGMLYRVNERGPELLEVGGRQFLMMGNERGRVEPMQSGAGGRSLGASIVINITGNTDRRTAGQIGAEVARRLAVASVRNN